MITVELLASKENCELDHRLSVSKVKTFESCKAKYKFNYILKLPKKEWDFHVFGTFLHDNFENFHRILLEQKTAPNEWAGIMKSVFIVSCEKFNEKLTKDQKKEAHEILQSYLTDMKIQYDNGTLPEVISVEQPFNININNRILLNGYIDRVQVDHDGILHVADYKTTKDKKYLKDFFQLETYAYVLFLNNLSVEKIKASFILLRHKNLYMTKEYTRDDVDYISKKFIDYADSIDAEKVWRPQPQFLCKYCDFTENCQAGQNFLIKRGLMDKPKMTFGMEKW